MNNINGFKVLIFGFQVIVLGMFMGWKNGTSIIDTLSDARLGVLLIIVGLIISFNGLRRTN